MEVAKIFWGKTKELSHKSSIRPDIPSDPVALLGFECWINEIISSLCMDIESIRLPERKFSGDKTLALLIGLNCFEKKTLESFAFLQQF